MTGDELLTLLSRFLPSQFDEVLFRTRVPLNHLSGPGVAQTARAIELLRYVEQQKQLEELTQIIRQIVGSGVAVASPPAAPVAPLPAPDALTYDAFLSYDRSDAVDRAWVEQVVVPRLEARGLRLCLEHRDFQFGGPRIREMERAVATSCYSVSIFTPAYLASSFREFESLIAQHQDLETRVARFVPIFRRPCQPRIGVRMVFALDLTRDTEVDAGIARLARQLRQPPTPGDASETTAPEHGVDR
jgi:hypothetical protein